MDSERLVTDVKLPGADRLLPDHLILEHVWVRLQERAGERLGSGEDVDSLLVAYVQQQGPQFIERDDAIPLVLGCAVGQISEHQIDWRRDGR